MAIVFSSNDNLFDEEYSIHNEFLRFQINAINSISVICVDK